MKVKLITVGKLKDSHIISIEKNYTKRIKDFHLEIYELKAYPDDIEKEQKQILKKLEELNISGKQQVQLLTEMGKCQDTLNFSELFKSSYNEIIFIIGGANGFNKDFIKKFTNRLSLSPMTLPHQLARLFLIEQIYRSQCILNNHPYHH